MKELKYISLVVLVFIALISSTVYVSYVYENELFDKELLATTFTMVAFYLVICSLSFLTANFAKKLKYHSLSAILTFFAFLTVGAIFDEVFSKDPSVVSSGEYFWACGSFLFAVLDFFNIKILSKLWNAIKEKLLCQTHT